MHLVGSKHQLDHILINSKWINSLRNCRADNAVELDYDHRIISILLLATSMRTGKGEPFKRSKCPVTGESCKTKALERNSIGAVQFDSKHCNGSVEITERYKSSKTNVRKINEKVVGKGEAYGLTKGVSDRTIHLKKRRDKDQEVI